MRPSILSRSVVAVATVAIGSVALAAVPATAAAPSGVTRDVVLTAAAGVRANPMPTGSQGPIFLPYDAQTNRALRTLTNRVCGVDPDGPELFYGSIAGAATPAGSAADGVVVTTILLDTNSVGQNTPNGRVCSFGALATTAGNSVLRGTATLTGLPPLALSGDVFTTPPVNSSIQSFIGSDENAALPTFSASGNATKTTSTKVKDTKTKKEKKAAKAKYEKRLKSAKKKYAKALDQAGSSKKKKTAAKKAYSKSRSTAKSTYRYAIASYKIVTKKTATPFAVSAKATLPQG